MQAEQVGDAHAAVDFGGFAGDELADLGQVGLGLAGHQPALFGDRAVGMGGVPDQRPARLQLRCHLRAHVLHRLEGADHAVELAALLGVGDGLVEHRLRCAQGVGGEHDAAGVDGFEQRFAAVGAAGQQFRRRAVEHRFGDGARAVDGLELGRLGVGGVRQIERAASGDDQAVGIHAVEHEHRLAVQRFALDANAVRLPASDLLRHADAEHRLAGGDARQPLFLLALAAGSRQRDRRHHRRRHVGHRRHRAA